MAERTIYSDEQKASVLAAYAAGGTITQIAEAAGIPDSTVQGWVVGRGVQPHHAALAEEKRSTLADTLTKIAWRIAEAMETFDLGNVVSPVQLMTSLGIAIDKAQLLKGEPTEIADQRHTLSNDQALVLSRLTPEQRDEYESLVKRLSELQSGQIGPELKPDEKLALLHLSAGNPQRSEQSNDIPVEESKPTD